MPSRTSRRAQLAFAVAVGLTVSCATPVVNEALVGHHQVRFTLPHGWEHLEHGRQQLFRMGEAQISLVDLGPATREGMAQELRAAASVWRSGRRRDAVERVRELRAPMLRFATSDRRSAFWKPWTDATYTASTDDDPAVGDAFDALIDGARELDGVSPEQMLEYVLTLATDEHDREVVVRTPRMIHGREWSYVETWNRVSHQDRSRIAYVDDDGYLLVLALDRGRIEETGRAFEALLISFEVNATPTR